MIEGQTCGTCFHYILVRNKDGEVEDGETRGQCRIDAPKIVVLTKTEMKPIMDDKGVIRHVQAQTQIPTPMFPPMIATDPGCSRYGERMGEK